MCSSDLFRVFTSTCVTTCRIWRWGDEGTLCECRVGRSRVSRSCSRAKLDHVPTPLCAPASSHPRASTQLRGREAPVLPRAPPAQLRTNPGQQCSPHLSNGHEGRCLRHQRMSASTHSITCSAGRSRSCAHVWTSLESHTTLLTRSVWQNRSKTSRMRALQTGSHRTSQASGGGSSRTCESAWPL